MGHLTFSLEIRAAAAKSCPVSPAGRHFTKRSRQLWSQLFFSLVITPRPHILSRPTSPWFHLADSTSPAGAGLASNPAQPLLIWWRRDSRRHHINKGWAWFEASAGRERERYRRRDRDQVILGWAENPSKSQLSHIFKNDNQWNRPQHNVFSPVEQRNKCCRGLGTKIHFKASFRIWHTDKYIMEWRRLFPAISGRAINDDERDLLGLPARMGGLGLANPTSEAEFAYATARQVTKPLVESILGQNERPMAEIFSDQHSATIEARRAKAARLESQSASIKDRLPQNTNRAVIHEAAEEKGASTWLTVLPLADFGFSLSKSEFRDALHLRYCWTPPRLPASCVCGQAFTVEHALSCSHGGYLGLRHNEVRDLLGEVLDEICVNVSLEPALKPLDGEQLAPTANSSESARVDIKAGGFWGESRHECAFFDVRVFYPHARSHRRRSLPQIYRSQEQEKRRQYKERILNVERGTFTPL